MQPSDLTLPQQLELQRIKYAIDKMTLEELKPMAADLAFLYLCQLKNCQDLVKEKLGPGLG